MDSWWCHWGFFPWFLLTKPCALRSTQLLEMSTRDFSWGKGGCCIWLTTYHPCSAERPDDPGALTCPEPLGPPWPVAGHLYLLYLNFAYILILCNLNTVNGFIQITTVLINLQSSFCCSVVFLNIMTLGPF